MMEYMIIEGRRKDSQIYVGGDRIYQKKSDIDAGIRLRCAKRDSCPGEAYICNLLKKLCCDKAHTCQRDPLMCDEINFRSNLKRLVTARLDLSVPGCFRLAAEQLNRPEVVERVKLASVSPNLNRIRRQYKKNMKNEAGEGPAQPAEGETDECPICLSELKTRPWLNVPCGHGFCKKCSDKVYKKRKNCPICRQKMKDRVKYIKVYVDVLSCLWAPPPFHFRRNF